MIRTVLRAAAALAVIGCGALGLFFRGSYTDFTAQEGYVNSCKVGEIPEQICISDCNDLKESLPEVPIVLKVTPTQDLELLFRAARQRVRVEEVLRGDEALTGQEINLTGVWNLSFPSEEGDDFYSLELNFVNLMRTGESYMVFVLGQVETGSEDSDEVPAYQVFHESLIAPIFSYAEHENVALPIPEDAETTYVDYTDVADNEFFADTEAGLAAMEELKAWVMENFAE